MTNQSRFQSLLRFLFAFATFLTLAAFVILVSAMLPAAGAVALARRDRATHDDEVKSIINSRFSDLPAESRESLHLLLKQTVNFPNNLIGLTEQDLLLGRNPRSRKSITPQQPEKLVETVAPSQHTQQITQAESVSSQQTMQTDEPIPFDFFSTGNTAQTSEPSENKPPTDSLTCT